MVALRPSDGLLEQVADYTREAVSAVTRDDLSAATPCSQWDLRALMLHLNTSLGALIEILRDRGSDPAGGLRPADGQRPGSLSTDPFGTVPFGADLLAADDVGALLAAAVWHRTERLVRVHDGSRRSDGSDEVLVDGHPLARAMVAAAGAVEIAVHSWDISAACGRWLPIPDRPAGELLDLAAQIVDGMGRPGLFASAVRPPPRSGPGDRLIALLGRTPDGWKGTAPRSTAPFPIEEP
jgi:hypothetical protein